MDLFQNNGWYPQVDIIETEKEVVLKAELPGMEQKDIDLTIEGKQLTIKGEKNIDQENCGNYIRRERACGAFCRTFIIDIPVQEDKIIANYKNGILEVVLSKMEDNQPRKIVVN
jgi:HSP20 family protein